MFVWNWIQRFGTLQIYKRKRVSAFIIDETVIQIGSQHFWLWICIEPIHSSILWIYISQKREKYACSWKKFIRSLVKKYGKHTVYTLMVEHGMMMMKHALYWDWNITYTLHLKKVWWKELIGISKIEYKVLMIIINAGKMNVIYFMYIIGYNSLFQHTLIQYTRKNLLICYKNKWIIS